MVMSALPHLLTCGTNADRALGLYVPRLGSVHPGAPTIENNGTHCGAPEKRTIYRESHSTCHRAASLMAHASTRDTSDHPSLRTPRCPGYCYWSLCNTEVRVRDYARCKLLTEKPLSHDGHCACYTRGGPRPPTPLHISYWQVGELAGVAEVLLVDT